MPAFCRVPGTAAGCCPRWQSASCLSLLSDARGASQLNTLQPAAVFRPALILMSGRFAGFVAAFAIPLVLARTFGQSDFGTYKQLFLVAATLFGIAQVGMAESLYYFLPYEKQQGGVFVCNTLLVLAGAGLLTLLGLWLWRNPIGTLLNNAALPPLMPLLGLYLMVTLPAVVLEIVMTVRKKHLAASATYALTDLLRALFLVVPVLLVADLRWLMFGAIAFALLRLVATVFLVRREFGTSLHPDVPALRRHLGYALPFGLSGLIEILQTNFHMYAVSWHFDAATFAIYAVGCLQVPLAEFLMASTSAVMMVNMRERIGAGDHTAVAAIWLDSTRKLALVFFPLVGVLLVCADPLIVLLFTDTYAASVPIFMLWTLSMLFMTLLTDSVLRVFAENRFLIAQNLVRLALIAVLIRFFLQHLGLPGAILVTLLATGVAKGLALWRIGAVLQLRFACLLPWRSLAITLLLACAALLPALLVKLLLQTQPLLQLTATGGTYVLACFLLLLGWGPLQPEERRQFSLWLRQPLRRFVPVPKS